MLTRRGLRVKVMQVLYMVSQDRETGQQTASRLLKENIRNTYRSLIYLLHFLTRLAEQVQAEADRRKAKYIPSEEDLTFNTILYTNPVTEYLRNSRFLKDQMRKERLVSGDEEELVEAVYAELKAWDVYSQYQTQTSYTIEDHNRFLRALVRKFLPANEAFDQFMEDMIPTWADEEQVVLAEADTLLRVFPLSAEREATLFHADLPIEEQEFADTLLNSCLAEEERFNGLIEGRLQNWELERVSLLDRILMKMALTEFLHLPTVPVKVSINEYLEISKLYSTPKSKEFINGVLDKLMIELKASGAIIKTGRGLIE